MNDDMTQPEPQPWHAADEKRPGKASAPVGTHSLTGGGADVGMPARPSADGQAERGAPAEQGRAAAPDRLTEPRASVAEILGRKP